MRDEVEQRNLSSSNVENGAITASVGKQEEFHLPPCSLPFLCIKPAWRIRPTEKQRVTLLSSACFFESKVHLFYKSCLAASATHSFTSQCDVTPLFGSQNKTKTQFSWFFVLSFSFFLSFPNGTLSHTLLQETIVRTFELQIGLLPLTLKRGKNSLKEQKRKEKKAP